MKKIKLYFTALLVLSVLNGCTNNEYAFPFINIEEVAVACTFKGDIHLQTQADVDNFILNEYCIVDGNLTIGDAVSQQSDIIDLSGLASFHKVNGFLRIRRNWQLTSLNGLENVFHVGGYLLVGSSAVENLDVFQDNTFVGESIFIDVSAGVTSIGSFKDITELDALSISGFSIPDLSAFSNLTKVNSVQLTGGNRNMQGLNKLERVEDAFWVNGGSLESYDGLDALKYVGGRFWIYQNPFITDLSGLESIETIGLLEISNNPNLQSLQGIENLKSTPIGIDIKDNPRLTSLVSFNNLSIGQEIEGNGIGIRNNDALTNLNGFETISNFTGLVAVHDNDILRDLCDLQSIFVNGTIGIVRIEDNFLNPTQTDLEIGTNCSI